MQDHGVRKTIIQILKKGHNSSLLTYILLKIIIASLSLFSLPLSHFLNLSPSYIYKFSTDAVRKSAAI